jgi:hypothetical protein
MQSPFLNPLSMQTALDDGNPPFKVVIIYDNFIRLRRAKALLYRVLSSFDDDIEVETRLWHFALLGHPPLLGQAGTEAAEGDMIIFALGGSVTLSPPVKNWIERWLPQKTGRQTAFVVLLEGTQTGDDELSLNYLTQKAADSGMDLFLDRNFDQDRGDIVPMPAVSVMPDVPPMEERVRHPGWWGWGIND